MPVPQLLIVGASVRAAAQSAHRAGFSVVAADLFADADLKEIATACRVDDYPDGLEPVAIQQPCRSWMYTGGLENYPALVDRIAREKKLLGNQGETLRRVRNPFRVAAALEGWGLCRPQVARSIMDIPLGDTWLAKPRRSCGGSGINFVSEGLRSSARGGGHYFQQYISGVPCSAVYVGHAQDTTLLGVTRQWIGTHWAGASGFRYAGSCGPLELNRELLQTWIEIGRCLGRSFSLRGLFGVDAIVTETAVWPVEVNPRYTASVEVLERGLDIRSIALHAEACGNDSRPDASIAASSPARFCGKAVLFAPQDVIVTDEFVQRAKQLNAESVRPTVADLPFEGHVISRDRPVATVLVEADALGAVERIVQEKLDEFRGLLRPSSLG
jgi:predicted ATP-grasp superfamily ATP-dependent carboligase